MPSTIQPFKNAPVSMTPSFQKVGATYMVHLEAVPPETGASQGQVFTLIFDTSGSMSYDACQVGEDATNYHTRMDMLKLVAELLTRMLTDNDTLYLVGFSDNGYELMRPTKMTAAGKEQAVAAIKRMQPSGCTNLWNALEITHAEMSKAEYAETIKHAIMLTDGEESYTAPHPEGTVGAFTALPRSFTLNIMGFGSAVNPEILAGLCSASGGRFSNVADFTTLATTSINIMAAALATCSNQLHLFVEYEDGSRSEHTTSLIQYGQSRNIVFTSTKKPVAASSSTSAPVAFTEGLSLAAQCRHDLTAAIRSTVLSNGRAGLYAAVYAKYGTTAVAAHCAEIRPGSGELVMGTADAFTWHKWGSKYSWAYLQALNTDQRMNFKEKGQAHLGAAVFERFKAVGDGVFSRIPKPVANGKSTTIVPNTGHSYTPMHSGVPTPAPVRTVANTADTNDPTRAGGCWSPGSMMLMADGRRKPVELIQPGDSVWTESGSDMVMFTLELGTHLLAQNMCRVGKLLLTWYHPVKIGGVWRNPCDIAKVEAMPMPKVYNVILQSGGGVVDIDGVLTISLGHELTEPGVKHSFFGSRARMLEAIIDQPGYDVGRVVYENLCAIRDSVTGDIIGWKEGGI